MQTTDSKSLQRLAPDPIALPLIFPQQAEIADKEPPADLTELGRILDERITEGDTAVVRGEAQERVPGRNAGTASRMVPWEARAVSENGAAPLSVW